jgi:hypothetical protein
LPSFISSTSLFFVVFASISILYQRAALECQPSRGSVFSSWGLLAFELQVDCCLKLCQQTIFYKV